MIIINRLSSSNSEFADNFNLNFSTYEPGDINVFFFNFLFRKIVNGRREIVEVWPKVPLQVSSLVRV